MEEIYDASTDDGCFRQLSTRLAEVLGARSGVIHWRPANDETVEHEISYSGYFSVEQMAEYGRHFSEDDLWSNAVRNPQVVNRAWVCEQLVSERDYENGRLYNDWIRPMGDDSFHAIGAAIRTPSIVAEIGFHRGRSQGAFEKSALELANSYVGHVARALEIRERISTAEIARQQALASLDVIGHALFTLHPGGKLLQHNAAGEAILERNDGVRLIDGRLRPIDTAGRRALEAAIERAGAPGLPPPSAFYLRRAHGGRYEVSVVSTASSAGRQIVVALTDPDSHDGTLASRLRDRYGLSASEAEVAVRLSEGASAQQLSDERKTSLDTVRTQIKAILAKMDCNRQAEVVTLVNQMPQFHMPTDDEAQ